MIIDIMQLTPRLLMASLSKPTILFPSAPEALKPLVQLIRIPCGKAKTNLKCRNFIVQDFYECGKYSKSKTVFSVR